MQANYCMSPCSFLFGWILYSCCPAAAAASSFLLVRRPHWDAKRCAISSKVCCSFDVGLLKKYDFSIWDAQNDQDTVIKEIDGGGDYASAPWCPLVVADSSSSSSRRQFMKIFIAQHHSILFVTTCLPINKDATAATTLTTTTESINFMQSSSLSSPVNVESLEFVRILGQGTYKTVYLVVDTDATTSPQEDDINFNQQHQHNNKHRYFALSVEPLRTKSQVKQGLRGIQIAEQLERQMMQSDKNDEKTYFFEQIIDWWFQPLSPVTIPVVVAEGDPNNNNGLALSLPPNEQARTKEPPSRFLGRTHWLVALKPVYEMDLRSFMQRNPVLYPVGESSSSYAVELAAVRSSGVVDGRLLSLPLTETAALNLLRDLCYAGNLMHMAGLVHLDIKPKNIMLSRTRSSSHDEQEPEILPVIIDFGFSRFVKQKRRQGNDDDDDDNDLCFVEPGRVRGEVGYVLAQDVALYRACQRGDVYAMGKTIYEVLFLEAAAPRPEPSNATIMQQDDSQNEQQGVQQVVASVVSAKRTITQSAAQHENDSFRSILLDSPVTKSRFHLSTQTRDFIMSIIQGQCREQRPMSFHEAERLVLEFMQKRPAIDTK